MFDFRRGVAGGVCPYPAAEGQVWLTRKEEKNILHFLTCKWTRRVSVVVVVCIHYSLAMPGAIEM